MFLFGWITGEIIEIRDVANKTNNLNNRISINHLCLIKNNPHKRIVPEEIKHSTYLFKCIPPENFLTSINDISNNKHSIIILVQKPIERIRVTLTTH